MSSGILVPGKQVDGRKDRHDDANSQFLQFCQ
jgi:hypothetical protein